MSFRHFGLARAEPGPALRALGCRLNPRLWRGEFRTSTKPAARPVASAVSIRDCGGVSEELHFDRPEGAPLKSQSATVAG